MAKYILRRLGTSLLTLIIILFGKYFILLFGVSTATAELGGAFFVRISAFYLIFGLANAFRGYPEEKLPNLLVIENGAVRTKLQAVLKNRNSYAVVTYILPKNGEHIDLQIKLLANDANTIV